MKLNKLLRIWPPFEYFLERPDQPASAGVASSKMAATTSTAKMAATMTVETNELGSATVAISQS